MSFGAMTPRRARQLWYAPVLALATALMMLRLFALARLLDIPNFAQVSAALLVSTTFTMLGCLGLQALLQRDMPIMFVRGRERAARVLLGQSVLVAYGSAVVAMLAALVVPLDFGSPANLVVLGIVHGLSQQLFVVASVESRSRGEPLRFAAQSLVRSLVIVAVGLATARVMRSAPAVIVAEALISLALAHGLLWQTTSRVVPGAVATLRIAIRRMKRVDWHAAGVLLLVSLLGFALTYADRWGAASALDAHAFANYAFAGTVLAIGLSAQSLVNASVYPMLARLYAREGQRACFALCSKLSLIALVAGLVLAVPAYFVLEAAVQRWYPAYDVARGLLGIFLVVAAFRVSDFWSSYMMITGFQGRLLKTNLLAGAAAALLWAAVARPWEAASRTPGNFALLAGLLATIGYAAVVLASWRCSREGQREGEPT
jgi:O-antigen/teichoic acid export membrane protein